jgi:hypothetical protein
MKDDRHLVVDFFANEIRMTKMNNKLWLFAIATSVFLVFGCSPGDSTTKTQPKNTSRKSSPQITEPKSTKEELAQAKSDIATDAPKAQLFENMGNHKRTIRTSS